MSVTDVIWIAVVVVAMIAVCYFTSGISNGAGTVFEKKSNVTKHTMTK